MAKPSVTLRSVKGSALTHTEADANFTNLRDATITVASGENSTAIDLNGTITFSAGGKMSVAESGGTVTYSGNWINNLEEDTTPQLGGNLDVNGHSIVSASNGNIAITPDGTGNLVLDGLNWPQTDGTADYVLKTNGAGQLSWTAQSGGGLGNVVEDTTPQLGGNLATNGFDIDFADNNKATFGADEDMWIYHDGGSSYIYDRGTGNLRIITNSTVNIDGVNGGEFMAQFVSNGAVSLYYDNSKKFDTTSSGISINGEVTTTGGNSTNWQTAYTWGNHASAGYLTSYTETDPVVGAVTGIVKSDGAGNITAAVAGTDYLASFTETNDLTAAVTWANVPDANITESSVTQHEAALTITESQISDLGAYLTEVPNSAKTSTFVYGKCAEAITKGQVVMFGGVQGDHVLLKVCDTSASGFKTQWIIGLAETTGALNDFIYVRTLGELVGIDTATNFNAGDLLYVSTTTPGAMTSTEPAAPNPKVLIAAVTKENITDGIVLVRPTLSFKITDLEDVDTASASTNDFLIYNGTKWTHTSLDISKDTTPVLGAALDVNDFDIQNNSTGIVSINGFLAIKDVSGGDNAGYVVAEAAKDLNFLTNGDNFTLGTDSYFRIRAGAQGGGIVLDPGSGKVQLSGMSWPASDGSNRQALTTDGANTLAWQTLNTNDLSDVYYAPLSMAGGEFLQYNLSTNRFESVTITQATGNELENLVEDTTPELGGNLHTGTNSITYNGSSSFALSFETTGMVNLGYIQSYGENIHVSSTTTGTWAPDAADGPIQYVAMTGNMTINGFSNVSGGQTISILLDNTGGTYTLTLGAAMLQAGGDAATLSGGFDLLTITCVDDQTPVYLAAIQSYS